MPKWKKELYDPKHHANMMKGEIDGNYQYDINYKEKENLKRQYVIIVEVLGFDFLFFNLRQLEIAIEYFSKKIKGSSKIEGGIGAADHWEVQRWFDRLPKGFSSEEKGKRIEKALRAALEEFKNDPDYYPVF